MKYIRIFSGSIFRLFYELYHSKATFYILMVLLVVLLIATENIIKHTLITQ